MAMETHHLKMYFLLKMVILQCHLVPFINAGCLMTGSLYYHQEFQVPKMQVLTYISCMYGLCKRTPTPKIAS